MYIHQRKCPQASFYEAIEMFVDEDALYKIVTELRYTE